MGKEYKKNVYYSVLLVLITFILGTVIFLIFGVNGRIATFGESQDSESSESVTCLAKNLMYPFFEYDNSVSKTTKIIMSFNNDKLNNIYLAQTMKYDDSDFVIASENFNHASMNRSFGSIYGADAFDANYYHDDSEMRLTLYANIAKLSEDAKKYFLINGAANSKKVLIENYKTQGFSCKDNTK